MVPARWAMTPVPALDEASTSDSSRPPTAPGWLRSSRPTRDPDSSGIGLRSAGPSVCQLSRSGNASSPDLCVRQRLHGAFGSTSASNFSSGWVVPAALTVRRHAGGVKRGLLDTVEDRGRLGGRGTDKIRAGVEALPPKPSGPTSWWTGDACTADLGGVGRTRTRRRASHRTRARSTMSARPPSRQPRAIRLVPRPTCSPTCPARNPPSSPPGPPLASQTTMCSATPGDRGAPVRVRRGHRALAAAPRPAPAERRLRPRSARGERAEHGGDLLIGGEVALQGPFPGRPPHLSPQDPPHLGRGAGRVSHLSPTTISITSTSNRGAEWRGSGTNASKPPRHTPEFTGPGCRPRSAAPLGRVGVFSGGDLADQPAAGLARVPRIGGLADQLVAEQPVARARSVHAAPRHVSPPSG
jgi:hypothetical protein